MKKWPLKYGKYIVTKLDDCKPVFKQNDRFSGILTTNYHSVIIST